MKPNLILSPQLLPDVCKVSGIHILAKRASLQHSCFAR